MFNQILFSLRALWVASALGLMLLLLTSCEVKVLRLTSSISPEPLVGRAVNYHVEVLAQGSETGSPVPNVTLTITLPSGVELIKGDLSWHGDIVKGEKITKDLTIRVTTPGEWVVKAHADTDMGSGPGHTYLSFTQALYITSSADSAEVVDALKKTPTPCGPNLDCGAPPPTVTPRKP
ncbi:MAG TPA: hypothetical protein VII92_09575 [Anaerolineae bacterium]